MSAEKMARQLAMSLGLEWRIGIERRAHVVTGPILVGRKGAQQLALLRGEKLWSRKRRMKIHRRIRANRKRKYGST